MKRPRWNVLMLLCGQKMSVVFIVCVPLSLSRRLYNYTKLNTNTYYVTLIQQQKKVISGGIFVWGTSFRGGVSNGT